MFFLFLKLIFKHFPNQSKKLQSSFVEDDEIGKMEETLNETMRMRDEKAPSAANQINSLKNSLRFCEANENEKFVGECVRIQSEQKKNEVNSILFKFI